ncbi:MAG: hypothetical protein ABL309_12705 [Phycisphaerales bacterium]
MALRRKLAVSTLFGLVLIFLLAATYLSVPFLDAHFTSPNATNGIGTLLVSLGSALIGGAAIAFTLVMFAMQVNVERLPHGLFRKFSTDRKLLVCFGAMFTVALCVILSSLLASRISVGVALMISIWSAFLTVILLWIIYRRALLLISPWSQLQLMVESASRSLRRSVTRASMLRPILDHESEVQSAEDRPFSGLDSGFDTARGVIIKMNPAWAIEAKSAVSFAVSFATRFSEAGDYETSRESLNAIIRLNSLYIEARGKTFIASHEFSSLAGMSVESDSFISSTLEQLRQYVQVALARKDEQQIEQIFGSFSALVGVYLCIEYVGNGDSRYHAELSWSYLSSAVKVSLSLKSPDVLMDGVEKLGVAGRAIVVTGKKSHAVTASRELRELSQLILNDPQNRVVLGTVMEQYAETLIALLVSDQHDIRFEAKSIQTDVCEVVSIMLRIPESTILGEHASWSRAFYSTTSVSSLCARLTGLASVLLKSGADDQKAARAVRRVQEWADDLWEPHREILQLAIKLRSGLTFDLIHWISQVGQLLMEIAACPPANPQTAKGLRRAASWLVMTLGWIPADKESIDFAERFQLTDQLFDIAVTSQRLGLPDTSLDVQRIMLDRAFAAARNGNSLQPLKKAVQGVCALNVMIDADESALVKMFADRLSREGGLSQEIRKRIARSIFDPGPGVSRIGYMMGQVDRERLRSALKVCAVAFLGTEEPSNHSVEEVSDEFEC